MKLSLLKGALKDVFGLPDAVLNRIIDGCDFSDFWITWYRLWQVYSNVAANGGSDKDSNSPDDKDNPDSHYNQFNQAHHDILVKSFVGVNIFSFVAKSIQAVYRAYRERQLSSVSYLKQQLAKVPFNANNTTSVTTILNNLLKKKITRGAQYEIDTKNKSQIKLKSTSLNTDNNIESRPPSQFGAKKDSNKPSSIEKNENFINQIRTSAFGKFTKKMWDIANGQALIFWIVWMFFNVSVGTKAIDPTPSSNNNSFINIALYKLRWILTPIILSITVGIMLVYGISKGCYQIYQRHNAKAETNDRPSVHDILTSFFAVPVAPLVLVGSCIGTIGFTLYQGVINLWKKITQRSQKSSEHASLLGADKQAEVTETVSNQSIISELRTRFFNKIWHSHFKAILKNAFKSSKENIDISRKGDQIPLAKTNNILESIKFESSTLEKHKQKLKEHIFGGVHERRFSLINHSVREGVKGFVSASFVLWWASYIVSVVATHVGVLTFLTGAAIVLSNPILAGVVGLTFAGLFIVKGFAKFRQERANYEVERKKQLVENHQNIVDGDDKLNYLAKLAAALEVKKQKIIELRTQIAERVGEYNQNKSKANKLNLKEWQASSYDMTKVSIYSHHMGIKQNTLFNYFSKGLGYTLEFLGGVQTGNFLARALFLAGSLIFGAASSLANPVFGFFIIAGALSLIVGGNRLADYILKRRQHHRDNFNVDVKISYAKKMLKQTHEMEKILEENKKILQGATNQNSEKTSDEKTVQKSVTTLASGSLTNAQSAEYANVLTDKKITDSSPVLDRSIQLNNLRFA